MSELYYDLMRLKKDKFIEKLVELSDKNVQNEDKKLTYKRFNLSCLYDLDIHQNVKSVLIPYGIIHYKKPYYTPVDVNNYLKGEKELTEQCLSTVKDTLSHFGIKENAFSMYHVENHLKKIEEYKKEGIDVMNCASDSIVFDSEIVTFDVFVNKMKEHFPDFNKVSRDCFISMYVYLIHEIDAISYEEKVFIYLKENFSFEEGKELLKRYIKGQEGFDKYSLPILYL